jgi:hypothetical protein
MKRSRRNASLIAACICTVILVAWLLAIDAPPPFVLMPVVLLGWPLIGIAYQNGRHDAFCEATDKVRGLPRPDGGRA